MMLISSFTHAIAFAGLLSAHLSFALPLREHIFERAEGNVTITAEYDFIIAGGTMTYALP